MTTPLNLAKYTAISPSLEKLYIQIKSKVISSVMEFDVANISCQKKAQWSVSLAGVWTRFVQPRIWQKKKNIRHI